MKVKDLGIPIYPEPVPHVLWEDVRLMLGQAKTDSLQDGISMREYAKYGETDGEIPDSIPVELLDKYL